MPVLAGLPPPPSSSPGSFHCAKLVLLSAVCLLFEAQKDIHIWLACVGVVMWFCRRRGGCRVHNKKTIDQHDNRPSFLGMVLYTSACPLPLKQVLRPETQSRGVCFGLCIGMDRVESRWLIYRWLIHIRDTGAQVRYSRTWIVGSGAYITTCN